MIQNLSTSTNGEGVCLQPFVMNTNQDDKMLQQLNQFFKRDKANEQIDIQTQVFAEKWEVQIKKRVDAIKNISNLGYEDRENIVSKKSQRYIIPKAHKSFESFNDSRPETLLELEIGNAENIVII